MESRMNRRWHMTGMVAALLCFSAFASGQAVEAPEAPADTDAASELPPAFQDTIEIFQEDFEMVLVPGDDEAGIEPFYLGKVEVTWNLFAPWVQCKDLPAGAKQIIARKKELRPSTPYGSIDRDYGFDGKPALGMSRLTAEKYCKWLSEQTGRTYRLPTIEEWEHAFRLGGNDPAAEKPPENLDEIAWHDSTAWSDDMVQPIPQVTGKLAPNDLGIHDMLGNVAEWVTDTGEERVVRGGHFWTLRGELCGSHREVETPQWNENYPNEPKSKWWFVDAEYVGFRLVCEVPADPTTLPPPAAAKEDGDEK